MRRISLILIAMLLSTPLLAQETEEPQKGYTYSSDSHSDMFLKCDTQENPSYVYHLDTDNIPEAGRSIGYLVNSSATVTGNTLTFQALGIGQTTAKDIKISLTQKVPNLTDIIRKGNLFVVFYPVMGKPNLAKVDFHAFVNGSCSRILGPYKFKGQENFPPRVQEMVNEPWNR